MRSPSLVFSARPKLAASLLALGAVAATSPALAQRTAQNTTTQAQNGFGKSIGNEAIGIYANGEVRGFSAADAGNTRIEGLYFSASGDLSDQIIDNDETRVGLSAFGQPFPAPTGLVDTTMRRVTETRPVVTARAVAGEYLGHETALEAAIPLTGKLGLNAGLTQGEDRYGDGASVGYWSASALARWQPRKGAELSGFASRVDFFNEEQGPLFYLAPQTTTLPAPIPRRRFFGQSWGQISGSAQNFGLIAKIGLGAWQLDAGSFRSSLTLGNDAAAWFEDTDAQGRGERFVQTGKDQSFVTWSGELRLSRQLAEGPRQHRLLASLRARDGVGRYGGYHLAALGAGRIGQPDPQPEPPRNFGPLIDDRVRQTALGLGYEMLWQGRAELNLGLSRNQYRKALAVPGEAPVNNADEAWLWNAALAITLSPRLSLYAAATRGLEESGAAPANVANANQALPALRTRQMEAGLSWRLPHDLRVLLTAFDLAKPYFDTDPRDNIYRVLGEVQHRGLEISLSGEPAKGLTAVLGAVLMDPRVTGEAVNQGRLGARPLGRTGRLVDASFDWMIPGQTRFSLDLRVLHEGRRQADALNRLTIPARTTFDLGARYRLKLGRSPALLRARLINAGDAFGWRVQPGGGFKAIGPRRASLSLTVDF